MNLFTRTITITVISVCFLVFTGTSYAANICWDGGGSTTNWSEDANWAGNVEPDTGDVAVFNNGTCSGNPNKSVTVDASTSVQGINIGTYTGTVTVGSSIGLTLGSSGFVQSGGTFDVATGAISISGPFTRTGGTLDGGSGTFPSGTVVYKMSSSSITGTTTFNNLIFATDFGEATDNIASGTILTVEGLLIFDGTTDANDTLNGPGEIHAQADFTVVGGGLSGDVEVTLNGSGTQTLTGESDSNTSLPSIIIDKTGTLNLVDTIVVNGDWIYTQGTINPGSSTVIFSLGGDFTFSGTHSLNNITFMTNFGDNDGSTIASGTTLTALGDLTFDGSLDNNDILNGPGALVVQGDFATITNGINSDVPITFTGTNSQTITTAGSTLTSGTFTLNKSSGTVTLATNLVLDESGQDLVISSGTLDMATFVLAVVDVITINGGLKQSTGMLQNTGSMTIGTTGWWLNNSTGDIAVISGVTITNNGYVRLDGTSAGCGSADGISLAVAGGTANLAGSGRWRVYDVGISNFSASPGITVYSSTNTTGNSGITFTGTCPSERTWIGSGNYNTGANWTGSTVPGLAEVAVFDATSTNNMAINTDPNDLGFQVNLGYTGTITQNSSVNFSLGTQGYEQNSGSFTGSNAQILIVGDFAMKGGTFASTSGPFYFGSTFEINGGTFNPGSGEVIAYALDAGNGLTTEFSGNVTLNDLRIYTDQCCNGGTITVLSGTTVTVNGNLVFDGDGADERNRLLGPGEIHAKGDIQIDNLGFRGDAVIVINGNGAQNLIGQSNPADVAMLPAVEIDKPSGTLTISDIVMPTESWTYTQGTLSTAGSTVVFLTGMDAGVNDNFTASGTHSLNNVTAYFANCCNPRSLTVSSGTVTAAGDLTIDGVDLQTQQMLGPGSLAVQGNLNITQAGGGATGDISLSFTGGNAQSITVGSSANIPTGSWSINKSSNTLSLASTLSLSGTGQDLTITQGTLTNDSFALTVNDTFTINDTLVQGTGTITAGTYTIGAAGNYTNDSTGDMVVGSGGVANSGTTNFGDPEACGADNEIAITSSSNGQQRSWSGSGIFNIYDVTVRDQGGSAAITAYSSQNISGNGANWTFDNTCPDIPDVNQILLQGGTRIFGGTRIDRD